MENTPKVGARQVKSQKNIEHTPRPARMELQPTAIYAERDLIHNLGCKDSFFRECRRRKDRPLMPIAIPTREINYLGEELIAFFRFLSSQNRK